MKVLKQIYSFNLNLVSVHPYKEVFLLFCPNSIYVFGEEKYIKKYKLELFNDT